MADIKFDINDLDLGDLEDIEEAAGRSFNELFPNGKATAKGMIAFVYITKRREDPDFTWDDARKVKVVDLSSEVDEVPPTEETA